MEQMLLYILLVISLIRIRPTPSAYYGLPAYDYTADMAARQLWYLDDASNLELHRSGKMYCKHVRTEMVLNR